ncbi:hypothetical protein ACT80S_08245 [Ramlibacter sp. MAHUQ-53]|uniref:hypothetical protein n=1 Tax=unclassified Ramlibacter TaxID=2617605 RepID=UPI00362AF94D
MSRFRRIVAWLIFVALPLQAMASVSMSLCGPLQGHSAAQGHGPGAATADAMAADHAIADHAAAGHHGASSHGDPASAADDGHRCASCAFCGHALAQPADAMLALPGAAPPAHASVPPARVASRGLPVPDKPPRA